VIGQSLLELVVLELDVDAGSLVLDELELESPFELLDELSEPDDELEDPPRLSFL
jgi:hypothetical protein